MLCPVYHALLEKYGFDESDYPLHGTCNLICSQAKEITKQRYYGTYHGNLISVLRTVQISQISVYQTRRTTKYGLYWQARYVLQEQLLKEPNKQNKYVHPRLGIKNLYRSYKVKLITIVFDYLGVYNKDLGKELNMLFGPKVAMVTIERSQKWVISQNCEIVKRFSSM